MSLIQQLEDLGQSGSLKQFGSVDGMFNHFKIEKQFKDDVCAKSQELVCMIEPDDDDDDTNKL
ncbi:hypothetical protein GCM10011365_17570 [Marinicella pacifica]|jgi:hypothetical protein|uniref:Uncharacterized protein n=1 Tax=Marinicella pacifica TaxID=1171543 RepID=A0A917FPY8_9GAMM|nr:hypothetical protein [Marinicella pacifica]GGF96658.1 hypothetical protein GCM10011365_17570 [Marinicella pacifica]